MYSRIEHHQLPAPSTQETSLPPKLQLVGSNDLGLKGRALSESNPQSALGGAVRLNSILAIAALRIDLNASPLADALLVARGVWLDDSGHWNDADCWGNDIAAVLKLWCSDLALLGAFDLVGVAAETSFRP